MKYAYVENGIAIEVVSTDPVMLFVPHYADGSSKFRIA